MEGIYIVSAILLIILGHIIKSMRWKQLISVYEDVEITELLLAMSAGQAINMIIPYRLGDIYKIWRVGKKNLDNGYVLSLATVIVDTIIDMVTVGIAFVLLYIFNIHTDIVKNMAIHYGILSIIVVAICIMAVVKKKYVKWFIQKIAGFFNTNIERKLLMASYTLLASMKDIFKREKIMKIFICTIGVWGCYFLSYDFFTMFLQSKGYSFTLTSVFKTIFSMSGDALFLECYSMGETTSWLFWFGLYFAIPLLLIIVGVSLLKKTHRFQIRKRKSNRIIPQINETERLSFLNIYFNGDNMEYFNAYLSINEDVSVLRDCSAGSNATTILAMNEETTFYRKYAFGTDAQKLNEQIEWLESYKNMLPLCTILNKKYKNDICYYDMEYLVDAISYFQYIHTASLLNSWNILKEVLDSLNKNLYSKTMRNATTEVVKEYVEKKVLDNIKKINQWCRKYYNGLFENDVVYINGNQYNNLKYFEKYLNEEYLLSIFSNDAWAVIHGDLTIENIVCFQGRKHEWYLIDPNTGSMHETPYLDYAKLLQSLHGKYEFFMMVKDVRVTENKIEYIFTDSMIYQALYEKYQEYLYNNFSEEQCRSIYYHEAIHWLRLMPYKIHKNPQSAVVFYAGMLMVLNDIERMFEFEKDS